MPYCYTFFMSLNSQEIEPILIKNTQLFLPEGIFEGDIYLNNGLIQDIGPNLNYPAALELKDKGLLAIPGCVDSHVHFRSPGFPDKETFLSGGRAALAGGVTAVCDMPNTLPQTTTQALLDEKVALAKQECPVDFFAYIGATNDNLTELKQKSQAVGIKIFVGSSTGNMLVDDQAILDDIFKETEGLICVHSEDETLIKQASETYSKTGKALDHMFLRPPEAALTCTQRLCKLALTHNRRLHLLHITTKEEVLYLSKLPKNNLITAEACIPHLFAYAPNIYEKYDTFAQVNPPIRGKEDYDAIRSGLLNGILSFVSTDHAPHEQHLKAAPFGQAPSGTPSIQYALPLLLEGVHQGHWSLEHVINWYSAFPAQHIGQQNLGQLTVGNSAHVVLIDLNGKTLVNPKTAFSKAKISLWDDQILRGRVVATIHKGRLAYREESFL